MEMNTEFKPIVDNAKVQLSEFYNGKSWVTDNFKKRVFSLPQDAALKKIKGFSHSVAELVSHMNAWRNFVLQKLTGNKDYDIEESSSVNWSNQNNWDKLRDDFELCHNDLLRAIENFPAERWNEKVPGRKYTFLYLICGVIQHDYYHYGQIGAMLSAIKIH